jgi:hypothetical protein
MHYSTTIQCAWIHWKMHAHCFLGLQSNGKRYKNKIQDICDDPKDVETMNQSHTSGQKANALSTW